MKTPFNNDIKSLLEHYRQEVFTDEGRALLDGRAIVDATPDFGCYSTYEDGFNYDKLDPGIREVVRWLVENGFEPSDSGDGKYKLEHGWSEEDIIPYPHVYMTIEPAGRLVAECSRLVACLSAKDIELVQAWTEEGKPHIECLYDPRAAAVIGLFNVTSEMITR